MAGSKQVKGRSAPTRAAKRVIVQRAQEERTDKYLVWRFGRLDHGGLFSYLKLGLVDISLLERELVSFQTMPIWKLRDKRWLKFIDVSEMTAEGRQRLAQVNFQENGLWQLHLAHEKWRVWGYFDDPEFFFLWWDGDHAVATGRSRLRRT